MVKLIDEELEVCLRRQMDAFHALLEPLQNLHTIPAHDPQWITLHKQTAGLVDGFSTVHSQLLACDTKLRATLSPESLREYEEPQTNFNCNVEAMLNGFILVADHIRCLVEHRNTKPVNTAYASSLILGIMASSKWVKINEYSDFFCYTHAWLLVSDQKH